MDELVDKADDADGDVVIDFSCFAISLDFVVDFVVVPSRLPLAYALDITLLSLIAIPY